MRIGRYDNAVKRLKHILVSQRAICWLTPRETKPDKVVVLAKRLFEPDTEREGLANGRRAALAIGIASEGNDVSVWS